MGYEDARATKLLATHCLCCSLPLLDALSVERNIGPWCWEKHGGMGDPGVSDEDRTKANKLVHEAALNECTAERRVAIAATIVGLGFPALAKRIIERFGRKAEREVQARAKSRVYLHRNFGFRSEAKAPVVFVHTPWGKAAKEFNTEFKNSIPWTDRTGQKDPKDGNKFWWIVREQHRDMLLNLLERFYAGSDIETEEDEWVLGKARPVRAVPTPAPEPEVLPTPTVALALAPEIKVETVETVITVAAVIKKEIANGAAPALQTSQTIRELIEAEKSASAEYEDWGDLG
jgi:hypothetical protein